MVENVAVDLLCSGLLIVIGCAMSLLIIQRTAEDRSKIDLCSWTAIGSAIAMPIAMYLGRSGLNDMGLDVFEFAKADDTSESTIYLRYMIHSGLVFYIIAQFLELVSKGFMWKTAKQEFKATIMVGIIACVSGLLFVLCSKSLSQEPLIICLLIIGILYFVYFIMLLIYGFKNGGQSRCSQYNDNQRANILDFKWIILFVVLFSLFLYWITH